MTMTMATARTRLTRTQLDHIVLGSNPNAESRWAQRTGRTADIGDLDFIEDGDWSLSCNYDRVAAGTIGWIARQGEGGNPPLGGIIICTDEPCVAEECDVGGNIVEEAYVPGRLIGGLWVPGDDIAAAGWPATSAPWGANAVRQFQNGMQVTPDKLPALLAAVPERTLRLVAWEYYDITGRTPDWA